MTAPAEVEKPYAVCKTCGVDLPTPDDASRHAKETMQPIDGTVNARSHTWQVINPTPQELAEREVRWVVEGALTDFCFELDRLIERGKVTREQVTEALRGYSDFADSWEDWEENSDG